MSTVTVTDPAIRQLTPDFEEIFRQHHQFVYRTAYGVTGHAEDAEDVLQTLFLQLLRRELPPELKNNPKPYLYRAAVNLSLNVVRLRKRLVLTDDPESLQVSTLQADSRANEAMQARLLKAVAQLTPNAVEILVLRYVHGHTDTEIAKLLGRSRGTIAITLFRSRVRLKRLLGERS